MNLRLSDDASQTTYPRQDCFDVRCIEFGPHGVQGLTLAGFQGFHHHVGETRHSRDQGLVAAGREDAGGCARSDQHANPLAPLGNDLPQAGHVLVGIVDTDGHRTRSLGCCD